MVNDDLYRNELYRIGGLKTLRGVNEASILCSSYLIGTLEYRFVFEENANFFLFVDQAWWEDAAQEQLVTDTPRGFGLGTSFETKAGLFSITYALGQQFDNPVHLRGGKVHFGFHRACSERRPIVPYSKPLALKFPVLVLPLFAPPFASANHAPSGTAVTYPVLEHSLPVAYAEEPHGYTPMHMPPYCTRMPPPLRGKMPGHL